MAQAHQPGEAVFTSILPEEIDWKPFPAFPPSARLAVLVGEPTQARELANQVLISRLVNSAACNLTKSYMLIGFWPVSLNRSSVMRS